MKSVHSERLKDGVKVSSFIFGVASLLLVGLLGSCDEDCGAPAKRCNGGNIQIMYDCYTWQDYQQCGYGTSCTTSCSGGGALLQLAGRFLNERHSIREIKRRRWGFDPKNRRMVFR